METEQEKIKKKVEDFFSEVKDPRNTHNHFLTHKLSDILCISLLAVLCGADNDEEIATYGNEKKAFLKQFLELPNGIPSHDTFTRVFRNLDPVSFLTCLQKHSQSLLDFVSEYHLAIDGKVLRATDKKGHKKSGICIITAWAVEQELVLGQLKTSEKSNEKTAIPALLESLDLKNAIVSIDAIANSPSNSSLITKRGGNYILALKKNQKKTYEQVESMMMKYVKENRLVFDKSVSFGSGRIETRTCYVNYDFDFMDEVLAWQGISSVIMVHSKREINDTIEEEYRFYLSSLSNDPQYFNRRIRGHWSIENKLHWHLDMSFDEDRVKTRVGNGAENHNILRKIVLKIISLQQDKHSIKQRRKKAGWNDSYLIEMLKNLSF